MEKVGTLASNRTDENAPGVIGIDLAKHVFAMHGVNRHGKPQVISRSDLIMRTL
jgi:hypothetical protein